MNERPTAALSGWAMAAIWLVLAAGTAWLYLVAHANVPVLVTIVWTLVLALALTGFAMVQPNQSKVVILFGRYLGTVRRIGWIWTWALASKRTVSLRVQNFESSVIKVNDAAGNPVEIAAVIVWRVVDTARAVFNVEKYEEFVRLQTETAVRHVASLFPYDSYEPEQRSLRANADDVMRSLHGELQGQLETARVEVVRTQLRRLAYAPEIAADMLRRQQAEAVVAARTRIVAGAVSMVQLALHQLSEQRIVELDEERKAAMVSNLLVVLCGEQRAPPVGNARNRYQEGLGRAPELSAADQPGALREPREVGGRRPAERERSNRVPPVGRSPEGRTRPAAEGGAAVTRPPLDLAGETGVALPSTGPSGDLPREGRVS